MKHTWLMVFALFVLAGCAGTWNDPLARVSPNAPRWPAPPEPSRVVYVTSITQHQDLFTESGFWNTLANTLGGPRNSRMVRPYAITVYPEGGLLVTDPGAACVHFYHWADRRYVAIGEELEGGLPSPVGVAVARDGSILVSDSRLARIERFTSRGEPLGAFGQGVELKRPAGIAVDPGNGDVFVVDVLTHTINVFDSEGDFQRSIGSNGSGPGEFNFPTHLGLDETGGLLVADSMNFRIQRLGANGTPMACFGKAGDAQGDFAQPKGVAAIAPDVFVAVEGRYDSLVFWNASGELLLTLGGAGSAPGEFWLPSGLAYDAKRQLLFVADSYNARVQVFHLQGIDSTLAPSGEETP